MGNRKTQSKGERQLRWEAEVVEYVNTIYRMTKVHGNARANTAPANLRSDIPIIGPVFEPPGYLHLQKRNNSPSIEPGSTYLLAITIVHPFFYPGLGSCPGCGSNNTNWDGWTPTGPREVHGVCREERALGYQLRCKDCKGVNGKDYCFATTSAEFWKNHEHWELPRKFPLADIFSPLTHQKFQGGIPYFFSRSAASRELFNLIIELRPALTSAGISEHICRMFQQNLNTCTILI